MLGNGAVGCVERPGTGQTPGVTERREPPGSWNSVTTGLAAIATMLLVHAWLVLTEDNLPSLLGVVLLPPGAALVAWGWGHSRAAVMALGIAVAFVGAAGPFWIMNAS